MTGSHAPQYRAEVADDRFEAKPVVRMWWSDDGTDGFGAMCQMFRADSYRDRRVRFSAAIRTTAATGSGALCVRVDGPDTHETLPAMLAFDNMSDRPIRGTTSWSRYACVVDVPREAVAIFISNILERPGELHRADIRFEQVDDSVPVTDMLA